jgi:peptidoglycan hydrolase-like protein with peptidoglycan-binding domain
MIRTLKFWKNIGLSLIVLGGLSILPSPAQARGFSTRSDIFNAQKRLRAKGYYRGPLDGRYNRRTMRALTNFQFDHNLAQTGRLNPRTCTKLGAACKFR